MNLNLCLPLPALACQLTSRLPAPCVHLACLPCQLGCLLSEALVVAAERSNSRTVLLKAMRLLGMAGHVAARQAPSTPTAATTAPTTEATAAAATAAAGPQAVQAQARVQLQAQPQASEEQSVALQADPMSAPAAAAAAGADVASQGQSCASVSPDVSLPAATPAEQAVLAAADRMLQVGAHSPLHSATAAPGLFSKDEQQQLVPWL